MGILSELEIAKQSLRHIVIIAGPNGAGKTTFAREYLPKEASCPQFVNADLIAAGLSPFLPNEAALRAGKLMLERIDELAEQGNSFAFETTLAGTTYVRRIRRWRKDGFRVSLHFLRLTHVGTAIERVERRVVQGGHSIPEAVIRRRFEVGLSNFERVYKHEVNDWVLYDSEGLSAIPLAWGANE